MVCNCKCLASCLGSVSLYPTKPHPQNCQHSTLLHSRSTVITHQKRRVPLAHPPDAHLTPYWIVCFLCVLHSCRQLKSAFLLQTLVSCIPWPVHMAPLLSKGEGLQPMYVHHSYAPSPPALAMLGHKPGPNAFALAGAWVSCSLLACLHIGAQPLLTLTNAFPFIG